MATRGVGPKARKLYDAKYRRRNDGGSLSGHRIEHTCLLCEVEERPLRRERDYAAIIIN